MRGSGSRLRARIGEACPHASSFPLLAGRAFEGLLAPLQRERRTLARLARWGLCARRLLVAVLGMSMSALCLWRLFRAGYPPLGDRCAADPEWRVSIRRYFNVAGGGCLGEAPTGAHQNARPVAVAGQMPRLTVYRGDYPNSDGTAERDSCMSRTWPGSRCWRWRRWYAAAALVVHNLGRGRRCTVLEAATGAAVPVRIAGRAA